MNPLHGDGYQFWSGIGGVLVGSVVLPITVAVLYWLRPTRCEELGCRRKAVRRHSQHGYPVCEKHLP